MKKVCKLAAVEYHSFYALRHTAASAAVAAGQSDVSVAQLLGHRDAFTTKRIYARAFEEQSTDRMRKMREFLLGNFSDEVTIPSPPATVDVAEGSDDSAAGVQS